MQNTFFVTLFQSFSKKMLAHIIIYLRLKKGKEDPKRCNERFGISSNFALQKLDEYKQFCQENNFESKVIWIHAVSVGESLSVLDFVKKISDKNYFIVFTTTTMTSAEVLKNKLPKNVVHQYCIFHTKCYVEKFLDTWKPMSVFFVENEIFPSTIKLLHGKKIPFYIINARISNRSFKLWKMIKFYIKPLLKRYSCIFALSEQERNKFQILSDNKANIKSFGNLKFDVAVSNKLAIEKEFDNCCISQETVKCKLLREIYKDKKIIVFGSIHSKEFFYILWQYSMMLKKINCIGIFVPRYINESDRLEKLALESNFNPIYWDDFKNNDNKKKEGNLVIVDKMNILQSLYKVCDIAVVCGSFVNGIGGHNPIESLVFCKPTFVGNYCSKSQDLIDQLLYDDVIIQTMDLCSNVLSLVSDNDRRNKLEHDINSFFKKHENVSEKIINEIGL